ncbi:hypothetical protein KBD59_05350 [Candidatus Gracilibacteria bacterium]|nr:hypothetical protein [Candidatus Gracilibacteria bacterium]
MSGGPGENPGEQKHDLASLQILSHLMNDTVVDGQDTHGHDIHKPQTDPLMIQKWFDEDLTDNDKETLRLVLTGDKTGRINTIANPTHYRVLTYLRTLFEQDVQHLADIFEHNAHTPMDLDAVTADKTVLELLLATIDEKDRAAAKYVNKVLPARFIRKEITAETRDATLPTAADFLAKIKALVNASTGDVPARLAKRTELHDYIAWLKRIFIDGLGVDVTTLPTEVQELFTKGADVTGVALDTLGKTVHLASKSEVLDSFKGMRRAAAGNAANTAELFSAYKEKIEAVEKAATDLGMARTDVQDEITNKKLKDRTVVAVAQTPIEEPPKVDDIIGFLMEVKQLAKQVTAPAAAPTTGTHQETPAELQQRLTATMLSFGTKIGQLQSAAALSKLRNFPIIDTTDERAVALLDGAKLRGELMGIALKVQSKNLTPAPVLPSIDDVLADLTVIKRTRGQLRKPADATAPKTGDAALGIAAKKQEALDAAARNFGNGIRRLKKIASEARVTAPFPTVVTTSIEEITKLDEDTLSDELTIVVREIKLKKGERETVFEEETESLRDVLAAIYAKVHEEQTRQASAASGNINRFAAPITKALEAIKLVHDKAKTPVDKRIKPSGTAAIYFGMRQEFTDLGVSEDNTNMMKAAACTALFIMNLNEPVAGHHDAHEPPPPPPAPTGTGLWGRISATTKAITAIGISAGKEVGRRALTAREDPQLLLGNIPFAKDLNLHSTPTDIDNALAAFAEDPSVKSKTDLVEKKNALFGLQMELVLQMIAYFRHTIEHGHHTGWGGVEDTTEARHFIENLKKVWIVKMIEKIRNETKKDDDHDEVLLCKKLDEYIQAHYLDKYPKTAAEQHAVEHSLQAKTPPPPPEGAHAHHASPHGPWWKQMGSHVAAALVGSVVDDFFEARGGNKGGGGGHGGHH